MSGKEKRGYDAVAGSIEYVGAFDAEYNPICLANKKIGRELKREEERKLGRMVSNVVPDWAIA